MLYSVFIWKQLTSERAEIYAQVEMPNAEAAVQEVMAAHRLPRVYYAWAAPADEAGSAEDFYDMRCVGVRRAGH